MLQLDIMTIGTLFGLLLFHPFGSLIVGPLYVAGVGSGWLVLAQEHKADVTFGTCLVQINQPCYSNPKIKFQLFSKGSRGIPFTLDLRRFQVPSSYNNNLPLKVIIHGFGQPRLVNDIIKAYEAKNNYNVLLVNWGELSMKPCYFTAALNSRQVGRCTGIAVALLRPTGHIHFVGFSLGAHASGYASSFLLEHLGRRPNRISGLDPALPLYATPLDAKKLDKTDADFVDIIHTSVGIFGKLEPSGHTDFYVNGVAVQPGCSTLQVENPALCSHGRATELFAETITNPNSFFGAPCSSFWHYIIGLCSSQIPSLTVRMGDEADPMARGIFLVLTSDSPPYTLSSHSNERKKLNTFSEIVVKK